MTEHCPISPERLDDRADRLGAGLVILLGAGILMAGRVWPALLLAADFGFRSRGHSAFSPVALAAQALRRAIRLEPKPINAGPKRFAAGVGAAFSLGIALAFLFHHPGAAWGLGLTLLACAALEAFLGFCVGCKVYSLLQGLLPKAQAPAVDR